MGRERACVGQEYLSILLARNFSPLFVFGSSMVRSPPLTDYLHRTTNIYRNQPPTTPDGAGRAAFALSENPFLLVACPPPERLYSESHAGSGLEHVRERLRDRVCTERLDGFSSVGWPQMRSYWLNTHTMMTATHTTASALQLSTTDADEVTEHESENIKRVARLMKVGVGLAHHSADTRATCCALC
jgi:hypothetical protein